MSIITYNLSIPTDNGFIGRECSSCNRYFKICLDDKKEHLFCPYCGTHQPDHDTWTKAQQQIIEKVTEDFATRFVEDEFDKMLGNLARGNKDLKYSPGTNRTSVQPPAHHLETKVDSEIECSRCKTRFQIFGIFGFCPGCKEDNINIYEVNLQIIKEELEKSHDGQRTLRHAYNDVVSTFENFCKKVADRKALKGYANFQNIKNTKDFFKDATIDIYKNISEAEKIEVKRMFEKRHLYQHGDGTIGDKYIKNIPEDSKLLGTIATLTKEEFLTGIEIVKKILKTLE